MGSLMELCQCQCEWFRWVVVQLPVMTKAAPTNKLGPSARGRAPKLAKGRVWRGY